MNWKYGVIALFFLSLFVGALPAVAQQQVPQGYQLLTDPQVTGAHLVATRSGSGSAKNLLGLALKEVRWFFQWNDTIFSHRVKPPQRMPCSVT